jgi:hypothetical protein
MAYVSAVKVVATSPDINTGAGGPGVTSIDGVTLTVGDPVLLVNQTTNPEQNGVWIWNGGNVAMGRPVGTPTPPFATGTPIDAATVVPVALGTLYGGTKWRIYSPPTSSPNPIIVDTTAMTFVSTNLVFDVRDFGAVCDGSTDDSAAIQAAINAASDVGGGEVFIPGNSAIANMIFIGTSPTFVAWSSGESVTTSTYDVPTTANGYYYKCTNAGTGTTAGPEPTWPTTIGATVADSNGVVWTCWARYGGGVRLRGPTRPMGFPPVSLKWTGGPSPSPMLYIRNAYGGGVENIGFDARGGAAYCLQFQQLDGDRFVVEHWNVDRCVFTCAAIENVLLGDPDAGITFANDVSTVCFNDCLFALWGGQVVPEPTTKAHVAHNASNGFGNTFLGCQFAGSSGRAIPIQSISTTGTTATVTCTQAHGLEPWNSVVFSGTGVFSGTVPVLDAQGEMNQGFPIADVNSMAHSFTVQVSTGVSLTNMGFVYKLGYPLYGVIAAAGRCAMYNCIDVGLGICAVLAPTPVNTSYAPGGISVYEEESQSANFADIQQEYQPSPPGAASQYPVVISGLHHTDISGVPQPATVGYGSYSVMWSRAWFSTLNIIGGNLDRGLVQSSGISNVTLAGTQFASQFAVLPGGIVSGAHTNLINGWWMVDQVQHTQFASSVQAPSVQIASSSTIYSGTGAPSPPSLGADGDYYFRTDDAGGSGPHRIYVKSGGTWSAIA